MLLLLLLLLLSLSLHCRGCCCCSCWLRWLLFQRTRSVLIDAGHLHCFRIPVMMPILSHDHIQEYDCCTRQQLSSSSLRQHKCSLRQHKSALIIVQTLPSFNSFSSRSQGHTLFAVKQEVLPTIDAAAVTVCCCSYADDLSCICCKIVPVSCPRIQCNSSGGVVALLAAVVAMGDGTVVV